jgi:F420-non-reducing hydrogenase large subunit
MTRITLAPVTRIEGHAKVTIDLDDSGNVADTFVNVVELRGFEKFCIGRPVEELPRIVTSICGVCPWSHHLASAKANDAVFGVTPPSAGRKLRELCNAVAFTEEHILHFFFLAGADYIMGPDSDYSVRNVLGIIQEHPEIGKKVVRNRHLGAQMLNIISGKCIQGAGVCQVRDRLREGERVPQVSGCREDHGRHHDGLLGDRDRRWSARSV